VISWGHFNGGKGLCEGYRTLGLVADIVSNLATLSSRQPLKSTGASCVVVSFAPVTLQIGHSAAVCFVISASTFVAGI